MKETLSFAQKGKRALPELVVVGDLGNARKKMFPSWVLLVIKTPGIWINREEYSNLNAMLANAVSILCLL